MSRPLSQAGLLAVLSIAMGWAVSPLAAQESELLDKGPRRSPEKEGLPLWTRPDTRVQEDLGNVTRALSRAVLFVGNPTKGHGTAWVLSRKHRLLATNAHVADILAAKGKMVAIVNGTEQVHHVERAWYHPGVRRLVGSGRLSIRSECPADGDIFPHCPDLAVLQLGEGPPLTAELTMATPKEVEALFAQTVGMLGFPGHDLVELREGGIRRTWPRLGEKAQATYHTGVISRLTNFRLSVNADPEDLQFVQHTIQNFGGFSGSPIYLANGHVVAINNSARAVEDRGARVVISYGIRVDSLWELLVHHGLDKKVPVPVEKSRLRIGRWLKLEEADEQFRRAMKLVEEAAQLIDAQQDFVAGIKKCTEAIELAPDYPDAYRVRCAGLNNYYFYQRPGRDKARQILQQAATDADRYAKLMSTDPRALVCKVNTANNVVSLTRDKSLVKQALATLDKALTSDSWAKPQRAELHSLRGMCHFNLGDRMSAREDFNESVRLDPQNDLLFDNRAQFWEAIGNDELADKDRARARAIRRKNLEKVKADP